jgi:hypothetical protein
VLRGRADLSLNQGWRRWGDGGLNFGHSLGLPPRLGLSRFGSLSGHGSLAASLQAVIAALAAAAYFPFLLSHRYLLIVVIEQFSRSQGRQPYPQEGVLSTN